MEKDSSYPFNLDEPLLAAIKISMRNGDKERARKLWDVFISYRTMDLALDRFTNVLFREAEVVFGKK